MSLTRGWRLFYQIVLLLVLFGLNALDDGVFADAVAIALVVGPFVSWMVAIILIWTSRQAPEIVSLRERADDALTLAMASTGFALAGAVTLLRVMGFHFDGHPVMVLFGYGALLVLVPGFAWLQTWRSVWLPVIRRQRHPDEGHR